MKPLFVGVQGARDDGAPPRAGQHTRAPRTCECVRAHAHVCVYVCVCVCARARARHVCSWARARMCGRGICMRALVSICVWLRTRERAFFVCVCVCVRARVVCVDP